MINAGLYSSRTEEWATPQDLFDRLDAVFHFDLDVCALPENAKCDRFFSPADDGLARPWEGTCWMNPPYGRGISAWVLKAAEERMRGTTTVALLPARTDTAWWQDWVAPHAEVHYLRGRLKFGDGKNSAPFPSAIAIYHGWLR